MKEYKIKTIAQLLVGILILYSLIPLASAALTNDGFNDGLIDGDTDDGSDTGDGGDTGDGDTGGDGGETTDPPYEPPAPYAEAGGPYTNSTGCTVHMIGITLSDGSLRMPTYRWDFGDGNYYEGSLTEPSGEEIC